MVDDIPDLPAEPVPTRGYLPTRCCVCGTAFKIRPSIDGWEYVPTPLAAGRSALAPPKRRKSDDRQKSLFSLGGRD